MHVSVYIDVIMFVSGDMVTPKLHKNHKLLLWGEGWHPKNVVGTVDSGSVCMVIKMEQFVRDEIVQEEWQDGSCMLLGPQGQVGWTGAGWLRMLPSASKT